MQEPGVPFMFWSPFAKICGDKIILMLKYHLPSSIEYFQVQNYINKNIISLLIVY